MELPCKYHIDAQSLKTKTKLKERKKEREGEGERESESEMKLRHGRIYCPENSILLSDSKSPVPPASENLFSTF